MISDERILGLYKKRLDEKAEREKELVDEIERWSQEDDIIAASNNENIAEINLPPSESDRADVLLDAAKLITGDRNASYGPPTQDFKRTADMWTALLQYKLKPDERIKPKDVAWMMIMLKASRAQHSNKRDNYVDAAGYAGCGYECAVEGE